MKNFILIALLIALFSCKSKSPETTRTAKKVFHTSAVFIASDGTVALNDLYRVDTVRSLELESNSSKKERVVDHLYFLPVTDTLRGPDGKPKPDSTGKTAFVVKHLPVPLEAIIIDYNTDMDSVVKKYTRNDTAKKN